MARLEMKMNYFNNLSFLGGLISICYSVPLFVIFIH